MIPRCVDGLVQLFLLFHTHTWRAEASWDDCNLIIRHMLGLMTMKLNVTSFGGIKHHPCVGTDKLLQQLHILERQGNSH